MDLSKSMADKSCRIPSIGAAGAALRVHALIPNCAQTGGFQSIIREVPKLTDWMVERGEFELSGDFVKPFSKPLLLLVADEKLTGGQPLQRESQAQVIEHQALEFAGQ